MTYKDRYIEVKTPRIMTENDLGEFEKSVLYKKFIIDDTELFIGYVENRYNKSSNFYLYKYDKELGEVYLCPVYLKKYLDTGEYFFYMWKETSNKKSKVRFYVYLIDGKIEVLRRYKK